MRTLAMKFGGASLGTATALTQVLGIIIHESERWDRILIVASALEGVTDMLLKRRGRRASRTGVDIAVSPPLCAQDTWRWLTIYRLMTRTALRSRQTSICCFPTCSINFKRLPEI